MHLNNHAATAMARTPVGGSRRDEVRAALHLPPPPGRTGFSRRWPDSSRSGQRSMNTFAIDHLWVSVGVEVLSHAYLYDESVEGHQVSCRATTCLTTTPNDPW